MDTKKLRQKILDLAIHGKLVPQDPNDEPASVLLERIKAEKERLIKEGIIKRSKKSAKTSDTPHYENVPFEVPDNWVWTIVGEVGEVITGSTPSKDIAEYYGGDIPFYKPTDLDLGINTNSASDTLTIEGYNLSRKLPVGSILVTCIGATIGKTGLISTEGACNQQINAIIPSSLITSTFLYYSCISEYFQKEIRNHASATTLPILNKNNFTKLLIPLPPLSEQQRIVKEIERWFALIDQIEQGKADLQTIIKQTKRKILDLAIHGKLVPQDPNDEPAIELLKRIHPDFTPCDNGHYTFDVPSGWITTNLGSIFNVVSAKRILKSDWKHSGVPFYRAREIAKLSIYGLVDNELYISEEHYNSLKEKFPVPKASDIMISAVGTIGKCYIVKESDKFYYKDASVLCLCNDYQINAKYIYHIMRSEYMLKQMYDNSKGTTVDTITIEKAKQYILPLPPLAEQQRIVAKIEEIFSIFDGIQNSLEA